jgi:NAD(P)-dependent dehydrogenase (short-subunit alcohol dehydrogenase family)
MVERRDGAIISIASDAGFGEPRMADYGPMKAGVMAFARIIAKAYGRYGVRSNTVCPGLVLREPGAIGAGSLWRGDVGFGDTQIADIEKATPMRRRPDAFDVAAAVVWRRRRRRADADRASRERVGRLQHAPLRCPHDGAASASFNAVWKWMSGGSIRP